MVHGWPISVHSSRRVHDVRSRFAHQHVAVQRQQDGHAYGIEPRPGKERGDENCREILLRIHHYRLECIGRWRAGICTAAVSTRLAAGSYTAPDNAGITAIKAKTDNLPSDPADQSLIVAATDAVMTRLGAPAGASVCADVAAVKADSAAVKGKTDSLTFNVAGAVDANISHVNEVEVIGTGASGDEWNPAP